MAKKQTMTTCGCGTRDRASAAVKKAVAVDPEIKEANLKHIRRIEGQVRGIARMVEEERYCAEIITQISALRESLQSVAKNLLHNHVKHCAAHAIRSGGAGADEMYSELVDLVGKIAR